jgi:hypothetical protein
MYISEQPDGSAAGMICFSSPIKLARSSISAGSHHAKADYQSVANLES